MPYSEELAMREALNERIVAVLVAVVILAVVGGVVYAFWDSSRDNAAKSLQVKLACIERGGTWLDAQYPLCLAPGVTVSK